ncbi:MFS transporter [Candidatus Hodarchaeum mangrovi]
MNKDKSNAWFTGNMLLLGLISFFADVSGEMMTPVLPLLIAELGGSNLIIGFIGGFGDAVANIVKVFSGYWADITGRRKLIISIGYGIPFFAKFGIGISSSWVQILILKPIERLGKGIRGPPRDALLADLVSYELRGKAFGFHRMMDTAGAIMGSFLALVIVIAFFDSFHSSLNILQLIIIISAFIALFAVIPIVFLTDSPKERKESKGKDSTLLESIFKLPKPFFKFLLISTIFGFANFTILIFIIHTKTVILGIDETTSLFLQTAVPIFLFIVFNITYTLLSIPFGSFSDKYGRKRIFGFGLILYIITTVGMALSNNLFIFIVIFGIYGAFNAATDGIQKAFAVDLLPSKYKGTGIGLLQTIMGLASIGGGIIAGALYDIKPSFAFFYGGLVAIIALFLLNIWDFESLEKD